MLKAQRSKENEFLLGPFKTLFFQQVYIPLKDLFFILLFANNI